MKTITKVFLFGLVCGIQLYPCAPSVLASVNAFLKVDPVNGNDSTAQRGNTSKPYLTVQAAVAAMQTNDVLFVKNGTYNIGTATLTIPAGATVAGQSTSSTIIQKAGTGYDPAQALFILGNNCIVQSLTANITNGGSGGPFGAVVTGGTNLAIQHCNLSGYTDVIYFVGSGTRVDHCTISSRWDAVVPTVNATGILITDSSFVALTNIAGDTGFSFVRSSGSSDATLLDCSLDGSAVTSNIYGLVSADVNGSTVNLVLCTLGGPTTQIYQTGTAKVFIFYSTFDSTKVVGTIVTDLPLPAIWTFS